MVLSCVFLWLNVWLSIISYVYWPSEFLFPDSLFMFLASVDLFLDDLCLSLPQEKVFWLLLQLSPFFYVLCLFSCIQTSTFVLGLFYFYLLFSSCLSLHSVLKKMFFNIISLTFSLLFKKCINKIWLIQFIDSTVPQFLIPDTPS